MKTLELPRGLDLSDYVNKIKSAIQTLLEISDIRENNDDEALTYEIGFKTHVEPVISIKYTKDDDVVEPAFLYLDDEQIDEDALKAFMSELGFDDDDYDRPRSSLNLFERRSIVMKRGMLNAFQESLKSSSRKSRACKKCGFLIPIYRGGRSKSCPVCSHPSDSIVMPYRGTELSSDRGAEATGAPPVVSEATESGSVVIAIMYQEARLSYYCGNEDFTVGALHDGFFTYSKSRATVFTDHSKAEELRAKLSESHTLALIAELYGLEPYVISIELVDV